MSFNVGLNYDWTKTSASHIHRSITRPGESFTEWIKEQYRKVYLAEFEDDANHNNDNETLVRAYDISLYLLMFSLKISYVFLVNPKNSITAQKVHTPLTAYLQIKKTLHWQRLLLFSSSYLWQMITVHYVLQFMELVDVVNRISFIQFNK
jgi:hypothetical protein